MFFSEKYITSCRCICIYILLYRTNIVVSYIQTKGEKRKLNIQFLRPFHFSSATLMYSIENHYKPVPHSLNIDAATATIQLRLDSIKKKYKYFADLVLRRNSASSISFILLSVLTCIIFDVKKKSQTCMFLKLVSLAMLF